MNIHIRLAKRQRIGIILSVIWAGVGWVLGNHEVLREASFSYDVIFPLEYEGIKIHTESCHFSATWNFKRCNEASNLAVEACGPVSSRDRDCEVIDEACEKTAAKENMTCGDNARNAEHAAMKKAGEYFEKTFAENWTIPPAFELRPKVGDGMKG
jgi:hypothetical protein